MKKVNKVHSETMAKHFKRSKEIWGKSMLEIRRAYAKDNLLEDTLELDMVFNNVPDHLPSPTVEELPVEVRYPVQPVKQFTKEEILALQDEIDKRNVR